MKKLTITAATVSALAATTLGLAGAAAAAPTGNANAQSLQTQLQDSGYDGEFNGSITAPLADCLVTGEHPYVTEPEPAGEFETVYIDVSCPPTND